MIFFPLPIQLVKFQDAHNNNNDNDDKTEERREAGREARKEVGCVWVPPLM